MDHGLLHRDAADAGDEAGTSGSVPGVQRVRLPELDGFRAAAVPRCLVQASQAGVAARLCHLHLRCGQATCVTGSCRKERHAFNTHLRCGNRKRWKVLQLLEWGGCFRKLCVSAWDDHAVPGPSTCT